MKLYEINSEIMRLYDSIEVDEETGELLGDAEELLDQIHSLEMEKHSILEWLAKLILNIRLDCLKYIRQLKEKNIPVFFEKESINTMDAKGEVLITIMASLTQQESQSLSQNVKLGLQYRYQQGKVQINHNRFLGYKKDADGNLVIDPEQAEIVKRIYREYLEGLSMDKIATGLEADGILTGAGKPRWHTSTINKILRNEKYIGDALLQKTYTTDFLNKTRVKNTGIVPQY